MGFLEILITAAFILFPFGEFARISLAKDITFRPVDIIILLLTISWLIIQFKKRRNILQIPGIKPVGAFFLICFLSLMLNFYWLNTNQFIISGFYLIRWLSYAGIYFAIRDTNKNFSRKFLPTLLLIDGLIILAIGIFQVIFFPSMVGMERFEWDRHMYRIVSVFLDPNFAGCFLVLYLLFVLARFFENLTKNRKSKQTKVYAAITIVSLLAVYLTYSRSALLMLLASIIAFFFLIRKKKYILILLASTIIYVIVLSPKFYIENLNLFRVHSSMERIVSAKIAVEIIKKNPVIGVGFNTYRYAQSRYKFRRSFVNFTSHADAGTDNSFLFVTATTGVIGLIAYLAMWFHLLRNFYKKSKEKNNFRAASVFASIIGLFVSGLFLNSLFFWSLMLWLWTIMGITDSNSRSTQN